MGGVTGERSPPEPAWTELVTFFDRSRRESRGWGSLRLISHPLRARLDPTVSPEATRKAVAMLVVSVVATAAIAVAESPFVASVAAGHGIHASVAGLLTGATDPVEVAAHQAHSLTNDAVWGEGGEDALQEACSKLKWIAAEAHRFGYADHAVAEARVVADRACQASPLRAHQYAAGLERYLLMRGP